MDMVFGLPVLAVVYCALASRGAPNKADEVVVRVASFNVEFSKSTTPEQVGEMFARYEPDLIGFCEVPDGDWTERAGKVLGMQYSCVGEISSADHKDKYKSILSRTPLEDPREHRLDVDRGWNPASAVRAVTQIRGVPIAFYSTHICASGKKRRTRLRTRRADPSERDGRADNRGRGSQQQDR